MSKLNRELVLTTANSVRPGEWFTAGDVATAIGRPGAAQGVSRILAVAVTFPWWRWRNADGVWSLGHAGDRARPDAEIGVEQLAVAEGIEVTNGRASEAHRVSPAKLAKRLAKVTVTA